MGMARLLVRRSMEKVKDNQGWVIVDGTHCCYCQLAEYACPKHGEIYICTSCGAKHGEPDIWLCKYCKNGGE